MPDNRPRRVGRGAVTYNRRGVIKGWDTTEVCTTDLTEIGKMLAGSDPNTRVWITVYGYVHEPSPELGDNGLPIYSPSELKRAQKRGEKVHLTIMDNRPYYMMGQEQTQWDTLRNLATFYDPTSEDYDIDYYCVRTKEPL